MKKIRIWFNHWFSTVYHIINLVKEDPGHAYLVIGTNENDVAVYAHACDEWYREPSKTSDEEYLAFCLKFCKEHQVDVFAPRKKLEVISKNYSQFEAIGVKLLTDSAYQTISMLDDKVETYSFLADKTSCLPVWRVARSFDEFVCAYDELSPMFDRICYKLAVDEGARSFRVVDDGIETVGSLYEKPGYKITWEAAKKVMKGYDFHNPVLLMPFLRGVEVSVDCLATASGNLIIPRYKTNKRYSEIIFDREIMESCENLMKTLRLSAPLNIQFKKDDEKFYLLEINPRMSGGVPLSCKATGINLPMVAVNRLLGKEIAWKYPEGDCQKVVHIETPICL